ncbi:MAG: hypothetical protein R3A78_12350 [Polyangiales bacterium]|nr:hypothetical protein [Myxococcales bacterium]
MSKIMLQILVVVCLGSGLLVGCSDDGDPEPKVGCDTCELKCPTGSTEVTKAQCDADPSCEDMTVHDLGELYCVPNADAGEDAGEDGGDSDAG